MGDGGIDLRHDCVGEVARGETGDGRCRLIPLNPVQTGCENPQGAVCLDDVARVVVIADRHSDVIERGQRVAVLGLDSR